MTAHAATAGCKLAIRAAHVAERRGKPTQRQRAQNRLAHIGSVAARLFSQYQKFQRSRQQCREQRREGETEQIVAVSVRFEYAREHNDVQETERGGEHVDEEIDSGLLDEHHTCPGTISEDADFQARCFVSRC